MKNYSFLIIFLKFVKFGFVFQRADAQGSRRGIGPHVLPQNGVTTQPQRVDGCCQPGIQKNTQILEPDI